MASSSTGASLGSSTLQNSGTSEGDLHDHVMDQRKRKRMLSNRESARRSRQRKQKHLDDLMTQVCQLAKENNQILTSMNMTSQVYLNIEAENSILRAQMAELNQRLESLNEIVNYVNSTTGLFGTGDSTQTTHDNSLILQPWSSPYMNHPITASADIFMY
ncbi:bZIP transcription factor 44-like [Juglans microcarpa x Juglans regia]|uniref:bZIP transcription factor 44-like n=1 Tax=Juglans microcarpa x Juglans regia TaxID=2249226 RepID=UPI001B7DEC82|nr:bZIP transcription factor 44-like [Juglans microcarpa x Juglans regia]